MHGFRYPRRGPPSRSNARRRRDIPKIRCAHLTCTCRLRVHVGMVGCFRREERKWTCLKACGSSHGRGRGFAGVYAWLAESLVGGRLPCIPVVCCVLVCVRVVWRLSVGAWRTLIKTDGARSSERCAVGAPKVDARACLCWR